MNDTPRESASLVGTPPLLGPPATERPTSSKLVVVVPALNESETIADVLQRVPRNIPGVSALTLLVVDDGSTDNTAELAKQAGAMVVRHATNQGLGVTFTSGIDRALRLGADVIVTIDADGQFNPEDIPRLVRPIIDGECLMTTCTRFRDPTLVPSMPRIKRLGNALLCALVNKAIGAALFTDVSCGFRAYHREAALRLSLFGRYTYTHESLLCLSFHGIRTIEVPLAVRGVRAHGQSRVAYSVWRYGRAASAILIRTIRDLRPLAFFGIIGISVTLLGVVCGLFVLFWWMGTGGTSPFRSVLLGSGVFLILGFTNILLALLADLLGRVKVLLEHLCYCERRRYYSFRCQIAGDDGCSPGPPWPLHYDQMACGSCADTYDSR